VPATATNKKMKYSSSTKKPLAKKKLPKTSEKPIANSKFNNSRGIKNISTDNFGTNNYMNGFDGIALTT
jgi:hypothetical protein